MKHPVTSVLLLVTLAAGLAGCGAVQIRGASNPDVSTVSGLVSSVHLTAVSLSGGTVVEITVVTLRQPSAFVTSNFCGNLLSQFAAGTTVRVDFTPSQPCSTVVLVVAN